MTNPAETDKGAKMNNLFMWDYQGKTEIGFAPSESDRRGNYFLYAIGWGVSQTRNRAYVTNLRPAKVVEADAVSNDAVCPCFACQCEPNQVTKDAIEEARNRNDTR